MLITTLRREWLINPPRELLAGAVATFALIPEVIAFSFAAGVDPQVGLFGSFVIGIVIAFTGGRPAMVSAGLAIGVGLAVRRTTRLALLAGIAVSAAYALAGSIVTPWLWLDPLASRGAVRERTPCVAPSETPCRRGSVQRGVVAIT